MTDQTVAIIGLGNMGLPMARRLIGAGHEVVGFDTAEPARAVLAAAGGRSVDSGSAAAQAAGVVILMLPDSNIVESVVDEIESSLAPGTIVLDMSSSEPLRTRALAERLGALGVRLVDAPVSGGVRGAEAGTLTIMVGGDPHDIADVESTLAPLGRMVIAGPIGAGHAAKALNNLMSATHLWATGEAVEVGRRFGIEPATLITIVNGSSGRSGSTENKWPNFVLPGTYNSGFGAGLMVKDMRIALGLADGLGVDTELGDRATALWAGAVEDLGPKADHTEIARWIAERGARS